MFKSCKIVAVKANSNEYHKDNADRGSVDFKMSSSALRMFGKSPSKWKNGWVLPPSASLEYGSLLDAVVLVPELFSSRYAVAPAAYETIGMECPSCKSVTDSKKCSKCKVERVEIKIQKEWTWQSDTCKEWWDLQINSGKEVVTQKELDDARVAAKRITSDPQLSDFINACEHQVWVEGEWHDDATGLVIKVKCLIDLVSRGDTPHRKRIGDLKSTKDASLLSWERWCHTILYELQAAWNTDMFIAATGRDITDFCFVLSESSHPFEIGRRYMSQDVIDPKNDMGDIASGRRQYQKLMAGYCQCVKSGKWPTFDDTDESSSTGWTLIKPDPYAENRRAFAPQFKFEQDEEPPMPLEQSDERPDEGIIP